MSLTLIPTLPRGAFGTRASGALPSLPPLRPLPVLTSRRAATLFADDAGAAAAEYAVATMAAAAVAGLLVVIMRSAGVRGILTDLVRRALTVA